MFRVKLERTLRFHFGTVREIGKNLLHLKRYGAVADECGRSIGKLIREPYGADLAGKHFLDGFKELLILLLLLLDFLLFILGRNIQLFIGDGTEGLALKAVHHLESEFIDVIGHEKYIITLVKKVFEGRHAL